MYFAHWAYHGRGFATCICYISITYSVYTHASLFLISVPIPVDPHTVELFIVLYYIYIYNNTGLMMCVQRVIKTQFSHEHLMMDGDFPSLELHVACV